MKLIYLKNLMVGGLQEKTKLPPSGEAQVAEPDEKAEVRNLSQEDLIELGSEMALIRINTLVLLHDNRRLFTDASNLRLYVKEQFKTPDE